MPKVLFVAWDRVFEIKDALGNKQYKLEDIKELFRKLLDDLQNIHEELAEHINTPSWNRPAFYDDDDDDDVDYTIAITPVLSTEEPDNSVSMGYEHLDTIPATKSDEVIKSSGKDCVPIPSESEGIPDTMCDVHLFNNPTSLEAKDHFEIVINSNDDYSSSDDDSLYSENIEYVKASPHDSKLVSLKVAEIVIPKDKEIKDDNLHEKLLKVHLLITKIEALKDNSTPSSKFLTRSSSTFPKSVLEETNTFDDSLPEFENFCFDLKEISSGGTTTYSDISLSDYEAFSLYDGHIEEISSGSTTTHSDISLYEYDSFMFDLSNDQCPPTDRSDFTYEEFVDELAHIISPPEYECFYFGNLPDPGEWISSLNSRIRENLSSTTRVNLPVEDDHSPLLAYVVWIFLVYLTGEKSPITKDDRSKGIEILFDLSLLEQLNLRRPQREAIKTIISMKQVAQLIELILNKGFLMSNKARHLVQMKDLGDREDDNDDDSDDDSKGDENKADSDDDEEDEDLYKDVDVRSLGVKQEQERKGDEEMIDVDQDVSHKNSYEHVVEDAHVKLTTSQKIDSSKQSSSVSSNFARNFSS
nr:hypothetical protein [Tanacetum cinerariifolium]